MSEEEIRGLKQQIRELEQEIRELRQDLETATTQVGQNVERITELECQLQELRNLVLGANQ